jgi:cAMP-dependent protein kinase regulator
MSDLENTLRFFANARILRMLDTQGRRRLLDAAEAVTFQNDSIVVKEGEPGDALYIISVRVDDMGAQKPVAELCDGAFFGEMAVITNQPRSATVVARGQLAVLKIPKQTVLEVLKDYPKVKEIIAKIGVARTEDTMDKMLED